MSALAVNPALTTLPPQVPGGASGLSRRASRASRASRGTSAFAVPAASRGPSALAPVQQSQFAAVPVGSRLGGPSQLAAGSRLGASQLAAAPAGSRLGASQLAAAPAGSRLGGPSQLAAGSQPVVAQEPTLGEAVNLIATVPQESRARRMAQQLGPAIASVYRLAKKHHRELAAGGVGLAGLTAMGVLVAYLNHPEWSEQALVAFNANPRKGFRARKYVFIHDWLLRHSRVQISEEGWQSLSRTIEEARAHANGETVAKTGLP